MQKLWPDLRDGTSPIHFGVDQVISAGRCIFYLMCFINYSKMLTSALIYQNKFKGLSSVFTQNPCDKQDHKTVNKIQKKEKRISRFVFLKFPTINLLQSLKFSLRG
jgi:hypothetical protein